ncbi:MAG: DHHA1 domain-containing protein [Candidatus Nanoarchaeia archaeon]
MLNKAALFIKESSPKETIVVYHGGCGDGIAAAAILLKVFLKLFHEAPRAKFASPSVITKLALHQKNIIFVDLAVDQERKYLLELKKKSKILIIDHHQLTNNMNKEGILHIHPDLFSKIPSVRYPGAKLVFDICSRIAKIDDLDWIAAVGMVHDISAEYWKTFIDKVFAKYPELGKKTYTYEDKIGQLASIITAGQELKNGNELALKVLLEAERPSDILETRIPEAEDLLEADKARMEELNYFVDNWEKLASYDRKLKLVIYDVDLKHKISSALSTTLAKKYPDLLFIIMNQESPSVLKINFRQSLEKIDCSWLAKVSTEFFGGSGGGHKPAAGGRIHPKYKEQFKTKVKELLRGLK